MAVVGSAYPEGYRLSITGEVICGDGHVVGGTPWINPSSCIEIDLVALSCLTEGERLAEFACGEAVVAPGYLQPITG